MLFAHFAGAACLLLACFLLLACLLAKLGMSTVDTKEGYKTKTGSTRSVTLSGTEYWDGAGGELHLHFVTLWHIGTLHRANCLQWPRNGLISLVLASQTD